VKLVILGNGFDLHHGLKTSFVDFRNHLLSNGEEDFVNIIDTIIEKHKGDSEVASMCWNDVERYFFTEFNSTNMLTIGNQERQKVKDELEYNMEEFTLKLFEYLKEISDNPTFDKNQTISKEISSTNIILTFNYTNLYKDYFQGNLGEVFHIHGDLSEKNLPLIGHWS